MLPEAIGYQMKIQAPGAGYKLFARKTKIIQVIATAISLPVKTIW